MFRLKFAFVLLAVAVAFAATTSTASAAGVKVDTKLGVPVGVTVTLSNFEAQVIGSGGRIDIPGIPSKFEKPFRKLASKIGATNRGRGVYVRLWVRVFPPAIRSRVTPR